MNPRPKSSAPATYMVSQSMYLGAPLADRQARWTQPQRFSGSDPETQPEPRSPFYTLTSRRVNSRVKGLPWLGSQCVAVIGSCISPVGIYEVTEEPRHALWPLRHSVEANRPRLESERPRLTPDCHINCIPDSDTSQHHPRTGPLHKDTKVRTLRNPRMETCHQGAGAKNWVGAYRRQEDAKIPARTEDFDLHSSLCLGGELPELP